MCSRLYKKSEVRESLTMPLHMSEECTVYWAIRKHANFLLKILFWPQTLVIWLLGNHNFGSWGSFWYFCESRRCDFLPNYTFSVLHAYLLALIKVVCYEQCGACHRNIYLWCLGCFVCPQFSSEQWLHWAFTERGSTQVMQGLVLACWESSDQQHHVLGWIFVGSIILRSPPSSIHMDIRITFWNDIIWGQYKTCLSRKFQFLPHLPFYIVQNSFWITENSYWCLKV